MNRLFRIVHSVRKRGILYSLGVVFCRVVPSGIVRVRVFHVFQIAPTNAQVDPSARVDPSAQIDPGVQQIHVFRCDSPSQRERAKEITRAGSVDQSHVAWLATPSPNVSGTEHRHAIEACAGLWIAVDRFCEAELKLSIALPEHAGWIFSAYVAKSHRQQGIYRQLLNAVMIHPETPDTFFVAINAINRASMSAHRRFVQRKTGTYYAVQLLGTSFCWRREFSVA